MPDNLSELLELDRDVELVRLLELVAEPVILAVDVELEFDRPVDFAEPTVDPPLAGIVAPAPPAIHVPSVPHA